MVKEPFYQDKNITRAPVTFVENTVIEAHNASLGKITLNRRKTMENMMNQTQTATNFANFARKRDIPSINASN